MSRSSSPCARLLPSWPVLCALAAMVACESRATTSCRIAAECPVDNLCMAGICSRPCTNVTACHQDEVCRTGFCVALNRTCQDQRQCLATEGCLAQRCELLCLTGAECPAGTSCTQGFCLVGAAAPGDGASRDGATRDGPAADHHPPDNPGLDATPRDVASSDLRRLDHSLPDQARPDLAAPDTTSPDRCPATCNGNATCQGGACVCNADFANCDGDWGTGCEIHLPSDVSHCGQCFRGCALAHAAAGCSGGACVITACQTSPRWDNCNHVDADGCETQIGTDRNCSACGDRCETEWCRYCASGDCKPDPAQNYCN